MTDYARARTILASLASNNAIFDDLALDITEIEYQGFNPLMLLAYMEELSTKAGLNEARFKADLTTLATIGTMRGSNLQKIKNKSTQKMKDYLNNAISTYKITSGTPKSNTDVTLIRIAAAMARIISKGLANKSLSIRTTVEPSSVAIGFPIFMCISTFGSLIPEPERDGLSQADASMIMNAFCYHQYKFDSIINSNKNKKTDPSQLARYANIQYQSDLYSQADRIEHCSEVGLITRSSGGFVIASQYRQALSEAENKWMAIINA